MNDCFVRDGVIAEWGLTEFWYSRQPDRDRPHTQLDHYISAPHHPSEWSNSVFNQIIL